MSDPGRLIFILVAVPLIIAIWHRYLWARLVRDTELPRPYRQLATALIVVMGLMMPLGMFLTRARIDRTLGKAISLVSFGWMGLAFLLFVAVLLTDLLKGARLIVDKVRGHNEPLAPEKRLTLSRLLSAGAATLGLGAAGSGVVMAFAPLIERVRVPIARLPAQLDGLKIVQLSDVHIGPTLGKEFLDGIVDQVNALSPDVIAITGDLVDGSVERLAEHVAPLARLRAKHGVFFVTGNHEYYSGAPEWVEHLATLGIRVLRNERVRIGDERGAIDIAGVDDWSAKGAGHRHDLTTTLAALDPARPVVLLAHQPRSAVQAVAQGASLVLSGHTHAGQIFPWRYLVYLQQPLVEGLHRFGDAHIYVNRGTGFWGPPMRVGARGEITELTLFRG